MARVSVSLLMGTGLVLVLLGLLGGGGVASSPIAHAAPVPDVSPADQLQVAVAITRYVAITGTDADTCATPAGACRTIQYAVDVANPGDLILVASGVYSDVSTRPAPPGYVGSPLLSQVVYITKSLAIHGGYTTTDHFAGPPDPLANPTIVDAGGQGRGILIAGDVQPAVTGLRITGGDATGLGGDRLYAQIGGGIYVLSATVTLSGNEVLGNTGGRRGAGGGIAMRRCSGLVQGNVISANSAMGDGGGVYMWDVTGLFSDNLIAANTAITWGGGVFMADSPIRFENNVVRANNGNYGSGMAMTGCDGATVRGNAIDHNSSIAAGGLYVGYTGWTTPALIISNTITANEALWSGAGVYIMYGPSHYVGNVIADNAGYFAAGVIAFSSDMLFQRNVVSGNIAELCGGGMYISYSYDPVFRENLFAANSAACGGGLQVLGSTPTLRDNVFVANTVLTQGGALRVWDSSLNMAGNVFLANSAAEGAGLYLGQSDGLLVNNVFADNTASLSGGGLYVLDSAPRLLHNTIARNGAHSGVAVVSEQEASVVALTNTILVSHAVGVEATASSTVLLEGTLWGNGIDWSGDGTIVTGTVNLWGDPAFVDPDGGDYHVFSDSLAVDAGIDAGVHGDIDGEWRPAGLGYDIGADEWLTVCKPIVGVSFVPTWTTLFSPTVFTPIITPADATPLVLYTWDFGDGSPPITAPRPVHTYDCGPYTVTLTAVNACSQQSVSRQVEVVGPPCCVPPEAGFTHSLPLVAGAPVSFTNTTTWCAFYPITYSWDFGDGSLPVTAVHPVHIYAEGGNFTVLLTASMNCGCGDWVTGAYSACLEVAPASRPLYLPLVKRSSP
ncbi:MAG: right-handed parallel beta-helix repeat-containing protein [Anaerolineae bacterium]|nr:right-handed parallel beta-helix repeat-containing protein [Anaerolineae bacterium]